MQARRQRPVPNLRRVTAYLNDEEWDYVVTRARQQGWTVSRFLSECIADQRAADKVWLDELAAEYAEEVRANG